MNAPAPAVSLTPVEDGIARLAIASDEAPYLDAAVIPALEAAVQAIDADRGIRAVVVEGGDRHFSAGASREALVGADARAGIARFCAEAPRLLLSIPVPTVAAMVGHAIGGGLLLGLYCDVAVLAEESLYGANFLALGFTPGMGSTALLEGEVGAPLAREMLFTGRLFKGRELKAAGGPLAHAVHPRAAVRERALAVAREMAAAPREASVLLKRALAARRLERFEAALGLETAMHATLFARGETRARIAQEYARPGEDPAGKAGEGGR